MLQIQVTLLTAWWAAGDAMRRRVDEDLGEVVLVGDVEAGRLLARLAQRDQSGAVAQHPGALYLRQDLANKRKAFGEWHQSYATALSNLGVRHEAMGDHKAALPLFQRARAIIRETQGEKSPGYAIILNNLAMLYRAMGDGKAALPLYEKALALRVKSPGTKHPLYAIALANLAVMHQETGDYKAALPLAEQALGVGMLGRL